MYGRAHNQSNQRAIRADRDPLLRTVREPSSVRAAAKPMLLEQMREALRSRHYSQRTEATYVQWIKRFIFFHQVRHPAEMAEAEVNQFLTHLAVKEKVSASTQNQALSALLFLYRYVLDHELGQLGNVIRARRPARLPVVMTREEVRAVFESHAGRAAIDRGFNVRNRNAIDGVLAPARQGH